MLRFSMCIWFCLATSGCLFFDSSNAPATNQVDLGVPDEGIAPEPCCEQPCEEDACLSKCGNSIIDDIEVCDGNLLEGQTCEGLEFLGGQLSCLDCTDYGTDQCQGATQIAVGGSFSCAIKDDQTIKCWGDGSDNKLDSPGELVTHIAAGETHSCAILEDDSSISCWGNNDAGQTNAPPGKFKALSLGSGFSCAINMADNVLCWGLDDRNQNETPDDLVSEISAGFDFACAILKNGSVKCWGANSKGKSSPPSSAFTQIDLGKNMACGITDRKRVRCWGRDRGRVFRPDADLDYQKVGVGNSHICLLTTNGEIFCSRTNGNANPQSESQTDIFEDLQAGSEHNCALREDGSFHCWGRGREGQLFPESF